MRKHRIYLMSAILLIVVVMVAGCNGRTKISDILNKPDSYMDKEVNVAGQVTETHGINLVIAEAGAYQIDDGTGKIWVVTKTSIPTVGTMVGVKGTVTNKISLLGVTVTAVIQEKERMFKN